MSEEIEPRKKGLNLFEAMDRLFEAQQKRFQAIRDEMDKSWVSLWDIHKTPVIKMGDMEEFQKSIEEFKKENPTAQITARAYTFSSANLNENKVFEYSDKQEPKKLPEKKKKPKKKK